MSKQGSSICPGCAGRVFQGRWKLPQQPVVLNYRYPTAAAARNVPRRDIVLRQCADCGLVFNSAFDAGAIHYDENYDNRQCFSPAFGSYLAELAEDFIGRHGLGGRPVLEVGCGKGDFLKLLRTFAGTGNRL